ncbi:MAG: integrin alpha [Candidatus Thorarchaeota archaeon]
MSKKIDWFVSCFSHAIFDNLTCISRCHLDKCNLCKRIRLWTYVFHSWKSQPGLFGTHFDGVGDLNGDGMEDFIIGETQLPGTGRAYLFHGRLDSAWTNLTLSDAQA